MSRELLISYAAAKLEIKKLEDKLLELYPAVLEFLKSQPDERPVELTGYGMFSLVNRKLWQYSKEVEDLEVKLKERKAMEQANGQAQVEIVKNIMFKAQ